MKEYKYTREIKKMMYCFGDCSKPLTECANLIESFVYQTLTKLIFKLDEIATFRGTKKITIEDFLFLYRNNKLQLKRVINFLKFKDTKSLAVKGIFLEANEQELVNIEDKKMKRIKICQDFFNIIDQTGCLLAYLENDDVDGVKKQRQLRLERLTKDMSTEEYLSFNAARQASFSRKTSYPTCTFQNWLEGLLSQIDNQLGFYALEILSFLANELVAELVEMCLQVQKDSQLTSFDPTSYYQPSNNDNQYNPSNLFTQQQAKRIHKSSNTCNSTNNSSASSVPPGFIPLPEVTPEITSSEEVDLDLNYLTKTQSLNTSLSNFERGAPIELWQLREVIRRISQPHGPFIQNSKKPLFLSSQQLFI